MMRLAQFMSVSLTSRDLLGLCDFFYCIDRISGGNAAGVSGQGRSDGGISVYIPTKISNRFVHVWDINICFEIAMTTAPVLLADYVTAGNGLKMASTAAYNLSDNNRYSIANFNFNLTLTRCSN